MSQAAVIALAGTGLNTGRTWPNSAWSPIGAGEVRGPARVRACYNFRGLRGDVDVVTARWLLAVVGTSLLSACATPRWVKPDASKSDLAQDQSVCMRTLQEPPPPGTTNEQVYQACMTTRGWTLQQRAGKQ
jgi:hypothetical protein